MPALCFDYLLNDAVYKSTLDGRSHIGVLLTQATLCGMKDDVQRLVAPPGMVLKHDCVTFVPDLGDGNCGYYSSLNALAALASQVCAAVLIP